MICKFHALMPSSHPRPPPVNRRPGALPHAGVLTLLAGLAGGVQAERADRYKPLTVEAREPGKIDLQKQFVEFNGDVVVTKGTMQIRAGRIELRETPDGYHTALALGTPAKPATFRQKRDGVDEYIEGEAARLEYDGRADLVRFITDAQVRRLRGATPADEIAGNLITYDATTEKMTVSGGAKATPANPGGRVTATLSPREGSEAAAEMATAASAAASAPLKLSPTLGASAPAPKGKP